MVGPLEGEVFQGDVLVAEATDDPVDLGRRPGQNDLMRAIVDRDDDVRGAQVTTDRLDALTGGRHGDQPRLGYVARRLETAKDLSEPAQLLFQDPVGPQHAGRGQGQNLAAAVAEHGVGDQTQPGQQSMQGPLRGQDDVHRRRRRPEVLTTAWHSIVQVLARGHGFTQLERDPVGDVEHATDVGKMQA